MANIYVRSGTGSDANNGASWAQAKSSLAGASGAASLEAAGDTVFLAAGHSETYGALTTITLSGAHGNETRVICVNDSGDPVPPSVAATGAVVETTGASSLVLLTSSHTQSVSVEGVRFKAGSGASAASVNINSGGAAAWALKNCALECGGASDASAIGIAPSNTTVAFVNFKDVWAKFAHAGSRINVTGALLKWDGGGLEAGGVSPTYLFGNSQNTVSAIEASSLDLSAASTALTLFNLGGGNRGFTGFLRNSKLPSGWAGKLVMNPGQYGAYRCEMHNCTAGAVTYGMWVETPFGAVRDEQTIRRTGGAGESHKFSTSSGASQSFTLDGVEIVAENTTAGTPITVSVEVLTDGVTLTDADCWLEVQYLASGGISAFASDGRSNTLAAATNQTASSADWTTTGLASPVKQRLSVTFTPAKAGFVHAVVKVAKPSTTVYVDPALTVA